MRQCFYAIVVLLLLSHCLLAEDKIFSISCLLNERNDYAKYDEFKRTDKGIVFGPKSQAVEPNIPIPNHCPHKRFFCSCSLPLASGVNDCPPYDHAPYDHTVVQIGDVETGKILTTLPGHEGGVDYAAFLPDGKVVTVSGNTVRMWDAVSGEQLPTSEEWQEEWQKVVLEQTKARGSSYLISSPDGKKIAKFIARDFLILIWDTESEYESQKLDSLNGFLRFAAFLSDGKRFITVSESTEDGYVAEIWDIESGKKLHSNKLHSNNSMLRGHDTDFSLSPNGETIALFDGKNFQIQDIYSGLMLQQWTGYRYIGIGTQKRVIYSMAPSGAYCSNHIAFSPDGRHVILWGQEYFVQHIRW